ncbi:hypothetical protein [Streptomyces sp. cg35]|uniref:hypothetical protein n=1 Tax=Streptomyces sp. cg35 TaxID=3421650 RepID=UPI003D163A79
MSARITLHCDTLWRYGGCTSTLLTDAATIAEARAAGAGLDWRHSGRRDYCATCSGSRRSRPAGDVVRLLHAPEHDEPEGPDARR